MEPKVNINALYAAMNASRIERRQSWRDVAADLGVSPSTLTRMAQGKRPDVDAFAAMVSWVKLPAERFMNTPVEAGTSDALAEVIAILRGNPKLDENEARVLENVLSATYQSLRAGRGQ